MHTGLDAGQCGSDSSPEHAIAFAIGVMCSVRTEERRVGKEC